ncbi:MAG: right-handed parallel beta-helix repeat-containing protein [Verrucomicrobiota bacterium]
MKIKRIELKRESLKKLSLLIILGMLWIPSIEAKTIYVATNGNDSTGNGSSSKPYKTVWFAMKKVNAGDTMRIKPGTYNETKSTGINKTGTSSSKKIIIRADNPSNRPTIDFNNTTSSIGVFINTPYVIWDGVHVREGNWGITVQSHHVIIRNINVYKCTLSGVRFYEGGNDSTLEKSNIYDNGRINAARDGVNNWPHAVLGVNSNKVTVKECKIYRNHGEGVGPYRGCEDWRIRDNEIYDNWSINLYIDTDEKKCTVERNLIYYTGYMPTSDARNKPDGIRIANEIADFFNDTTPVVSGIHIRNNIIINCRGGISSFPYAPKKEYKLKNSTIVNNTIYKTVDGKKGIRVDSHDGGVKVRNNIVRNTSGIQLAGGVINSNNFTGDPKFVFGSGQNNANSYKLKSASPCRNAGTSSNAPSNDYGKRSRPLEGVDDIGAWEY